MLNKEDILNMLKREQLDTNKYWLTSTAALVLHGVKESANDIDIGAGTDFVNEYISYGKKLRVGKNDVRIVSITDYIEVIENWYVDKIEYIDDIPVASLEDIKRQKLELGRQKDFADIELINIYQNKVT